MPFLSDLKRLDTKSTPPPWSILRSTSEDWPGDYGVVAPTLPENSVIVHGGDYDIGWGRANADMLVLLRNHAARIAAVVEAAQSLVFALPDAHMSIRVGGDKPEIEALRAALAALEAP